MRSALSLLVLALVAVAAARQLPVPPVVYKVNPTPGSGYTASCPPTVFSTASAFMCYQAPSGGNSLVWVSPDDAQSTTVGPATAVPANGFVFPPIALSQTTGLGFATAPGASFVAEFSSTQAATSVLNTNGTTANVAYAPDLQIAFVPFGANSTAGPFYDSIVAYATASGSLVEMYRLGFAVPPAAGAANAISTPVYYRGLLLVTAGTAVYKFNASTGDMLALDPNPCNTTAVPGSIVSMFQFTYGQDTNGNLDGFLLAVNTSSPGKPQTTFCRISHNSLTAKWTYIVPSQVNVFDVTGMSFTAMVTGQDLLVVGDRNIATFGFDAEYGVFLGKLPLRSFVEDSFNFPRVLPIPTNGCYETFVLTMAGSLTAYCTETFVAVWTAPTKCHWRAEVDVASNSILCVSRGTAVNRLDFGGNVLWSYPANAQYAATVVEDLAWFVDGSGTLSALAVVLPFVTPPATTIQYQVHPAPANKLMTVATCPPTVASTTGAFICYRDAATGVATVQFVDPSGASPPGPAVTVNMPESFIMPPIAVSNRSAIAYSNSAAHSFFVFFGAQEIAYTVFHRSGARGSIAYAQDLALAFVPIGMKPPMQPFYELIAHNVSSLTTFQTQWFKSYPYAVESPIYYRGLVVFVTGTTFFVLNAETGFILVNVSNPCNMSLLPNQTTQLFQISYGSDAFGPLDAFVMVGNTSNATINTTICRVSHNDGTRKWFYNTRNDIDVLDVTGAAGTVLLTGRYNNLPSDGNLVTLGLDAVTGKFKGTINRNPAVDYNNFPVVLPQAVSGCIETMVLQVNGQLAAYCTNVVQGLFYTNPVWTSPYGCNNRARADVASATIACVQEGQSVTLIDFFGNAIWSDSRVAAAFVGNTVDGVVWVVDASSTLFGLSIVPGVTPQGAGAPEGLTGGEVVLVVFVVVFLAVLGAAVGYTYVKRSKRRKAYTREADIEGSYGSLTGS